MDLLAYHQVRTSQHHHRALLVAPATYGDMLSSLLLSKGVNPETVGGGNRPPEPPRAVRVFDGASEVPPAPHHVDLCERFARANLPRDMAKKTSSSAAGIAWLLGDG